MTKVHEFGTESFAEALTYFPEQDDYHTGPEELPRDHRRRRRRR